MSRRGVKVTESNLWGFVRFGREGAVAGPPVIASRNAVLHLGWHVGPGNRGVRTVCGRALEKGLALRAVLPIGCKRCVKVALDRRGQEELL